MAKEFSKKFYSSKQWQSCRNEYVKYAHHLCENCLRKGIYKPGVIVHHIEELTPLNINNPEVTLSFSNLELVCRECHDQIHDNKGRWAKVNDKRRKAKADAQRFAIDENGRVFGK